MEGISSEENKKRKLSLVRAWLNGYITSFDDNSRAEYIQKNTKSDYEARLALAQLLMNGELPLDLSQHLANALAPDNAENIQYGTDIYNPDNSLALRPSPSSRRLDFVKRSKIRETNSFRNTRVVDEYFQHLNNGKSITQAYVCAAKQFNMTPDAVRKICYKSKSYIEFLKKNT